MAGFLDFFHTPTPSPEQPETVPLPCPLPRAFCACYSLRTVSSFYIGFIQGQTLPPSRQPTLRVSAATILTAVHHTAWHRTGSNIAYTYMMDCGSYHLPRTNAMTCASPETFCRFTVGLSITDKAACHRQSQSWLVIASTYLLNHINRSQSQFNYMCICGHFNIQLQYNEVVNLSYLYSPVHCLLYLLMNMKFPFSFCRFQRLIVIRHLARYNENCAAGGDRSLTQWYQHLSFPRRVHITWVMGLHFCKIHNLVQ